ncbi:MAG: TlpA disulfide reductase family protein [Chloroflexota bacterium]
MPQSRLSWSLILLATTLLGSGWIVYSRESAPEERFTTVPEAPIVGHFAPDFTLTTPEGETVTLTNSVNRSGEAGVPVVLNFWATWCGPCRIEMPHLEAASEKFDGEVAFIGVNQAESLPDIIAFRNEFNLTYPLLPDEERIVNNLYGVTSLPTTIFIDASGIVREVIIGTVSQGVLEDRIVKMMEE